MVAAPHIADWCVVAAPHSTTVAPPAVSVSLHGEAYTTTVYSEKCDMFCKSIYISDIHFKIYNHVSFHHINIHN